MTVLSLPWFLEHFSNQVLRGKPEAMDTYIVKQTRVCSKFVLDSMPSQHCSRVWDKAFYFS